MLRRAGDALQAIVAEITNTPWGERHQYVLPERPCRATARPAAACSAFEFDKEFHVSPFMPMDMQYRWCFSEPAQRLFVNMQNFQGTVQAVRCDLEPARASPSTPAALVRTLAAYPLMTLQDHRRHPLAGIEAVVEAHPLLRASSHRYPLKRHR